MLPPVPPHSAQLPSVSKSVEYKFSKDSSGVCHCLRLKKKSEKQRTSARVDDAPVTSARCILGEAKPYS
jgi:hypothetical protein